ncbi:MAG TPA: Holliday junction resolvase RuvX [Candidatus Binatus sp.]|uniref:Holliday junction resolvase RuvX n=1 Tax=Candidatus Binatus sp. TaxID=2811406 RepID=UPI002B4998E3|nr:Holliday junction resolvase RuvX [Candidatus Binatus sp.]HKN12210.1 Holliday junction resolvase RuvX [Candidatus Binatus sp.]
MAIAALDLGRRRIGVAVTDAASMGAHPLGIVERRALKHDLDAIAAMLRDRDVSTIVVGLPLNMDGSEGPAARVARKFAERLCEGLRVSVEMFDERLTSFEARDRLEDLPVGKGKRKTGIDALAAVVILEGWMQAHRDKIPPAPS